MHLTDFSVWSFFVGLIVAGITFLLSPWWSGKWESLSQRRRARRLSHHEKRRREMRLEVARAHDPRYLQARLALLEAQYFGSARGLVVILPILLMGGWGAWLTQDQILHPRQAYPPQELILFRKFWEWEVDLLLTLLILLCFVFFWNMARALTAWKDFAQAVIRDSTDNPSPTATSAAEESIE